MSKGRSAIWRDAIRDDSELDSTAKLVAHTLSTYANGYGLAYPSRDTLAKGASLGAGLRSVDAAISHLEAAGFIVVERSRGRSSHRYTLTLPPTAQAVRRSEWATAQEVRGKEGPRPRTKRPPTAHLTTPNSAARAPESIESVESSSGAAPAGAPLPLSDCMACGEEAPLHEVGDRLLCSDCREAA